MRAINRLLTLLVKVLEAREGHRDKKFLPKNHKIQNQS